jgi:hypothetical protein
MMKNIQQLTLNDLEFSILERNFGAMFTEGDREDFNYSVYTTENEGVSQHGQGYDILKENNNHNVHEEGICWNSYLASATRGVRSETGDSSVIEMLLKRKFNGQEKMVIIITKEEGNNFVRCEATNILNCISQRMISRWFLIYEFVYEQLKRTIWRSVKIGTSLIVIEFVNFSKEMLKQEYRYLIGDTNYPLKSDEFEVSNIFKDLVILVTEGEKGVLPYEILPTEND